LEESGLVMRKLADSTRPLVASPGLLAELGGPLASTDLTTMPSFDW
jgi:hypothetical protein